MIFPFDHYVCCFSFAFMTNSLISSDSMETDTTAAAADELRTLLANVLKNMSADLQKQYEDLRKFFGDELDVFMKQS